MILINKNLKSAFFVTKHREHWKMCWTMIWFSNFEGTHLLVWRGLSIGSCRFQWDDGFRFFSRQLQKSIHFYHHFVTLAVSQYVWKPKIPSWCVEPPIWRINMHHFPKFHDANIRRESRWNSTSTSEFLSADSRGVEHFNDGTSRAAPGILEIISHMKCEAIFQSTPTWFGSDIWPN